MSGIINRNNSIAEENIDPYGRHPATDKFKEWSAPVLEKTEDVYHDTVADSSENREKLIEEMEEIIKKELE